MLKRILLLSVLLVCASTTLFAQDADGDTVLDYIDLDSDNDGILDTVECIVPIADYSFENTVPYGPIPGWISPSAGSHNLEASNYIAAADGVQFLYLNSFGASASVTLDQFSKTFEVGTYNLIVAVGDGIFDRPDRNDNQNIIEIGYGSDAASFIPLAQNTIGGDATIPGTWIDVSVSYTIPDPALGGPIDPALGQGILVRITHVPSATPVGINTVGSDAGNYDNIRLTKDTDGDGLSDCIDVDSDDPTNSSGCFDGLEAGHQVDIAGQILSASNNPDGTVNPIGTAYTGTTQAVLDANITTCDPNYLDFDGDGVLDAVDLDDDNDGISDYFECEIPIANAGFEDFSIAENFIQDWRFIRNDEPNPNSNAGLEDIATIGDGTNYNTAAEGATYAYINGNGSITLNRVYGTFEVGGYTLELQIGDGFSFDNQFRNDGQTTIEIGFHDGDFTNFTPISGATRVIESWQTANGTWSKFAVSGVVLNGDPGLGQAISVRITHAANNNLLQGQGNYDALVLYRDSDTDGISDCNDLDSDNDGCFDVVEAGHSDNGGGLLGTTVDNATGLVTGAITGYTGARWQQRDNSVNIACNPLDTDGDGIIDGDFYQYDGAGNLQTNIDEDNDNDGLFDFQEDCNLINGSNRQFFEFENPQNNFLLGGNNSPYSAIDFWQFTSGTGELFSNLVNAENYTYEELPIGSGIFINDMPNYKNDGTLLPDLPDPDYRNDAYLSLNDNLIVTQTGSGLILQEGVYLLTIAVGDGVDATNRYRNDGISIIEVGYDTNASNFGVNYNPLAYNLTINPEDTPNGTWKDFSFNFEVPAGSPAIGNTLSVRIEHQANNLLNQQAGNYDHIRIQRNTDGILTGDFIPDCMDLDSDEDGCPDSIEAGFEDEDLDGVLGTGAPTVNGQGTVTSTAGYTTPTAPVLNRLRTSSEPVTIDVTLNNTTAVCEGQDATLTITASRAGANPTIEYEWAESTDAGVTWTILEAYGTGTDTYTLTAVTAAQDTNQYRIRARGDDYFCYEESVTTLAVSAAPSTVLVAPTNVAICEGENAVFQLSGGDATDIVSYTIDGGATTAVTLDAAGEAVITEVSGTTDVVLSIISIEDGTTSCVLTLATALTSTVTVNTEPVITAAPTTCAADLLSYEVAITLSAGTITAISEGTQTGTNISGIAAGNDLTVTVDNNGCIRDLIITAPDCSCPTINLPINPVEAAICEGGTNPPISVEFASVDGGDTISWFNDPTGGVALATGLSFTSTETGPGSYTYYAEASELASGCTSPTRVPVTFTIHPTITADVLADTPTLCDSYTLPALSVNNNYFTGSGGTGTPLNAGELITTSQTIFIFAASTTTPICTDESSFDVSIDTTPALEVLNTSCALDLSSYTVSLQATVGVLTSSAGTVVGNDSVIDIPAGTDITITMTNNACSDTLVITAPDCSCPPLDLPENPTNGTNCEGQPTASLSVTQPSSGGDTINWFTTATGGTPIATGTSFTPIEIIPGTYTYYAENFESITSCSSTRVAVTHTVLATPVADVLTDQTACEGYALPGLSAGSDYFTGTGGTGTALNAGELITMSQTIFIFASSGTTPACTDESSFDVTIDTPPTLAVLNTSCALDLSSYAVSLQATIGVLTSSAGTVVGNNSVIDIPTGTDITITITNNSCTETMVITAPDCSCPPLDIPENPTNGASCEGQPTANLSVTAPSANGDSINWFTTASGGTAIASGANFTPTDTVVGNYTYYAENRDSVTGCTSDRVAVTLSITAIPSIDPVADVTSCEFYTLANLPSDQAYFTGPNGTGNTLGGGQNITSTQRVYILATAEGNENCQTETSFNVRILQEPILDIPPDIALCTDANGIVQDAFLGTDLGPGFRYDWTPNNDTNGDGIEEAIFRVTTAGTYTLQVYQVANGIECGGFSTYSTNVSNVAQAGELTVEVTAEGYELNSGNRVRLLVGSDPLVFDQFEYSITGPDGPYQADNIFTNVDGGLYTGYVRAISGCGSLVASDPFLIVNYPTFFTPNGDGINETWRPLGLENLNITGDVDIYVYDRHGKLLTRLDPLGPGWDGTYNGQLMTPTDYWFKAFFRNELDGTPVFFNGHFSLKR